ncbi:hypothetical protein EGW08_005055 [Elysia chlorotica]|uniref:Uncharacterized protein n=1 Tax=Elysia chlorotica TaxID=188477 RepID=A0A3S1HW09_ELYCH|nr:hypothetical protein EGW08_005055 [Elysia chlorotica]
MSSKVCSGEGQDFCQAQGNLQHKILRSRLHGDIEKTELCRGEGQLKPQWESQCVAEIIFDDYHMASEGDENQSNRGGRVCAMTLGQSDSDFMRKVETCVMTMCKGEKSKFVFGVSEEESPLSAANEDHTPREEHSESLSFTSRKISTTITLHNFSQTPPSWKLTSEEKYNLAQSYKAQGTELFKSGKTEAAFNRYSRAVKYLICIHELSTVSETGVSDLAIEGAVSLKEMRALQCVCYLNLAACQAKVSNHPGVIGNCTAALALDSSSVKALYRRAVANIAQGEKEKAMTDLKRAQKLEPRNSAISSLLQTCQL